MIKQSVILDNQQNWTNGVAVDPKVSKVMTVVLETKPSLKSSLNAPPHPLPPPNYMSDAFKNPDFVALGDLAPYVNSIQPVKTKEGEKKKRKKN